MLKIKPNERWSSKKLFEEYKNYIKENDIKIF